MLSKALEGLFIIIKFSNIWYLNAKQNTSLVLHNRILRTLNS
jgi:hypothetical protein